MTVTSRQGPGRGKAIALQSSVLPFEPTLTEENA
jgi:hypothetical protein